MVLVRSYSLRSGNTAYEGGYQQLRKARAQNVFDAALVQRIAIAVEKAHGDRLDAGSGQPFTGHHDVPFVERLDNTAVGGNAFADLQAIAARDQRLWLVPAQIEHVGHADAPDLEHVTKAARRDQAGAGTGALQDGVGAHRGAVQHLGDGCGASANSRNSASSPMTTARLGSSGVVAILLSCSTPRLDSTTMSVNVPPMSTATRNLRPLVRPAAFAGASAIEPALGEAEQALRHEDHHSDENDPDGHEIGEFSEVGKVESGRQVGEQTRKTLAQT